MINTSHTPHQLLDLDAPAPQPEDALDTCEG
jgi:hypothetical protein